MRERQVSVFLVLLGLILAGCGISHFELYRAMPEQDKDLYDRSQQFMTEDGKERFLLARDAETRARMIEELHIQDRLARFPAYVQEAIRAQRIVPGMTAEAVLLSWGRPREIDRRAVEGVETDCWFYDRPAAAGQVVEHQVFFLAGQVSEIIPK